MGKYIIDCNFLRKSDCVQKKIVEQFQFVIENVKSIRNKNIRSHFKALREGKAASIIDVPLRAEVNVNLIGVANKNKKSCW